MSKSLGTMMLATAILATGSLPSTTAQAAPTASHAAIKLETAFETVAVQHRRTHRHAVRQTNGEITSFSSSSVGVNHPPKK
jgi:hypothetical protein